MQRVKTFDSSGVAANGRLYAGDLNAIQDLAAALTDFAQVLSTGSLRVGASDVILSRIGAAAAQLTGDLVMTGAVQGSTGIWIGVMTTAARNALASGKAPTGAMIWNSTTNELQVNAGTDGARNWQAIPTTAGLPQAVPTGVPFPFAGTALPSGYLFCDGAAVSRTTYATLFSVLGTTYGVGDGSTTFNVPDIQGRMVVGKGTHADVSALGQSDGLSVGSRRPKHKHSGTTGGPSIGTVESGGGSSIGTGVGTFAFPSQTHTHPVTVGPQTGSEPTDSPAYITMNWIIRT